MAFTVEDGTIVAGANSYLAVADADIYWSDRNESDWSDATTAAKQAALIKATAYLVEQFRTKWKGIRVSIDQTLDWPRAGVLTEDFFDPQTGPRPALFPGLAYTLDEDIVPQEVKDATADLALIALTTDLNPALERGGKIESVKAGSVAVTYAEGAPGHTVYRNVHQKLLPLLRPAGGRTVRG